MIPRISALPLKNRRFALGLGPVLGLTLALVTLVVALGRLAVVDYVAANGAEASLTQRLDRGLSATAAFLNEERTRTLLGAEAATDTPGLPDAILAGDPARVLPLLEAARRTANLSELGAADANGKLLASTPATNLPLTQANPVRQALAGRSVSGPIDDGGVVAVLAAAPLRQGDRVVGATLALQRLDDNLLTNAARDGGQSAALLLQGRVVAATSAIRSRVTAERNPPVVLTPASPGQPGRLTIGSTVFDVASQAILAQAPGREVILVVGVPSAPGGLLALLPRSAFDWASAVGAAVLAGAIGWLVGSAVGRSVLGLASASSVPVPLVGKEVAALAAALAAERAEATRLRAVLDAIDEGIIVSDPERRVIATNAAARTFLGLNGAGATGAVLALLPSEGSAEFRANARVLRSYSAPVVGSGGALGVVTVLRDATAEREGERLRGEFLSVVSHELQTPLTAIVGAADLLLDGEPGTLTAEQVRFVGAIRRNGDRLIALVNDLLDVSRLEAGRVELDRQPLDLGGLARSSVRAMANLFEQKGQSVVVDVPGPEDPPVPPVLGDRRRLEQVLANLLANAGQYTPVGGRIEVRVRAEGDTVVLTVADNGPGISAADQAHLFDKFYRGSSAANRRERGSGLGLAIVRSLVELHGGRVWLDSAPGAGTRISVALPAATPEDE